VSKSSIHHDRDGIATRALSGVLPSYWLYKSPADIYSHKEYSEDLIVEIVDNDSKRTVTGVEFGVQNKTDIEVRKRHVTAKLHTEDVKRLIDLQRPILIHGYHIETGTSYWIWLNEWYPLNVSKLRPGKKVAIKIPKRNVLDIQAVSEIEQYVKWEHRKRKTQENAEFIARHHAHDYIVHVLTSESDITTVVDPKHEGAIPVIHVLDEAAYHAIVQAIEIGKPVPLTGAITISNIPDILHEVIKDVIEQGWIIPNIAESEESPLKIELFDNEGNVLVKTPYVKLRLVQPGTVIKRWEALDTKQGITYGFTLDFKAETTSYTIKLSRAPQGLKELRKYLNLFNLLRKTTKIHITNLETEMTVEREGVGWFDRKLTLGEEMLERMAEALFVIDEKLGVSITLPEKFDEQLVAKAEWIAEILRDGAVKIDPQNFLPDNAVLICGDPASIANKMLEDFQEQGWLSIGHPQSSERFKIDLFGHELDLGLVQYVFGNVKIINFKELREKITPQAIMDNESIKTIFDVDRNEVYLVFEQWSPKDSFKKK
jgi:hypothetical protein